MKRIVAKCTVFEISIIVPVMEAVVVPPHGLTLAVTCPACHARHLMQVRDEKRAA